MTVTIFTPGTLPEGEQSAMAAHWRYSPEPQQLGEPTASGAFSLEDRSLVIVIVDEDRV